MNNRTQPQNTPIRMSLEFRSTSGIRRSFFKFFVLSEDRATDPFTLNTIADGGLRSLEHWAPGIRRIGLHHFSNETSVHCGRNY